jgi:hypothetical protein
MIKKAPKVFTLVFVPHSQKQSRSVSISMRSVYLAFSLLCAFALFFIGYSSYKSHVSHKDLLSAIRQSSALKREKSQIAALSDKLILDINQLTEENRQARTGERQPRNGADGQGSAA